MSVTLIATEISGLSTQEYPSSAVNRLLLNAISASIVTNYNPPLNWYNESAMKLSVLAASGVKYTDTYTWYNTSSNQFSNWLASAQKLSLLYTVSASVYAEVVASGEKWYKAYQSGTKAVPDASLGTGILTRTAAFTYGSVTDNSAQWNVITTSGTKYSDIYTWFNASSGVFDGLKDSGTKYSDTYSWYNASGNQFKNWLDSGEKLSRWFSESSTKLGGLGGTLTWDALATVSSNALSGANIGYSGTKYSEVYNWYNTSSNQYSNWLSSGEKLSRWFSESSMKLGEIGSSGEKWYKAYQSGQKAVPDASLSVGIVNRTAAFTYAAITDNSAQWNAIATSGEKYTDVYNWFNASSSGFDGLLDSGTKYSKTYSWFNASANTFDGLKDSGTKYSDTYSWYNATGNQFANWLASGEKLSRWFKESSQMLGSGTMYSKAYASANALRELSFQPATITTPLSGQVLTYKQNNARWENTYPSITFSVANVFISANSTLNLARFETGSGKNCYLWQAGCCGSGGATISGLCIQYSGASNVTYKTSSSVIQQGNPLATSTGPVKIRMMYSGSVNLVGGQYGTAFANVSIY